MSRQATPPMRALILVFAVALVVAGCRPAASTPADRTAKIGLLTSLSGPAAALGRANQRAVNLVVDQVNAKGGVGGVKLEVLVEDDKSDPSQAVVGANKLIDAGVQAIIGPGSSTSALAVAPIVERARVPTLTAATAPEQVDPLRKYLFMAAPNSDHMVEMWTDFWQQCGNVKTVAILHDTGAFGVAGKRAATALVEAHGMTMLAAEPFEVQATDFSTQLNKAKGADAILVWTATPAAVTIAKQAKALGISEKLHFSAAQSSPSFLGPAGADAEGARIGAFLLAVVDQLGSDVPNKAVIETFIRDYQTRYNEHPDSFADVAYGAISIYVNALEKAGTSDPDTIVATIERERVVGSTGTYEFSPTQHAGLAPNNFRATEVRDGKLLLATCGS